MKKRLLTQKDRALLELIAPMTQHELLTHMGRYFIKKYGKGNVLGGDDFVVAIGNIPVALVAHCDTVFHFPPERFFYDKEQNIFWAKQGLGADDRAGVFAILKIIQAGYRPHIILTTDEEIGCRGALKLAEYECPFKDLRYIIELDRQGEKDCVFYRCYNPKFIEYIETFDFITAPGSFTDIVTLCPIWGIAGVNLSIGYEDEHSESETLNIDWMYNTIDKVKIMLDECEDAPHFKYMESKEQKWY